VKGKEKKMKGKNKSIGVTKQKSKIKSNRKNEKSEIMRNYKTYPSQKTDYIRE
jgi:hypothetical protein